jgi:hypothetical protein
MASHRRFAGYAQRALRLIAVEPAPGTASTPWYGFGIDDITVLVPSVALDAVLASGSWLRGAQDTAREIR